MGRHSGDRVKTQGKDSHLRAEERILEANHPVDTLPRTFGLPNGEKINFKPPKSVLLIAASRANSPTERDACLD